MKTTRSVVMLGATGAVGHHAARRLAQLPEVTCLSLLGRRPATHVTGDAVEQHTIDIFDSSTYASLLPGHDVAVCTLGVGEPSKMSKEEFVRIDHDAVLTFATCCRQAGVRHFELLSSVGVHPDSKLFYMRTKGHLEASLKALEFDRLSLFHPSMIITPTNRYGVSQAIALAVTPWISPLLFGPLRRYRGIHVDRLGIAMAMNVVHIVDESEAPGVETLHWDDFMRLSASPESTTPPRR